MARVRVITVQVRDYFLNIPFKTYVTVMLELIGLFANMIAIVTFFGAVNTPKESPNFYINNQEFFMWSLIAGVYSLGLLGARFKRRWRQRVLASDYVEEPWDTRKKMFSSNLKRDIFVRDFCFTLLVTFPLSLLYMRAYQTATNPDGFFFSPWVSLWVTVWFCLPITLFIMMVSSIFDKAMSLFAGD